MARRYRNHKGCLVILNTGIKRVIGDTFDSIKNFGEGDRWDIINWPTEN